MDSLKDSAIVNIDRYNELLEKERENDKLKSIIRNNSIEIIKVDALTYNTNKTYYISNDTLEVIELIDDIKKYVKNLNNTMEEYEENKANVYKLESKVEKLRDNLYKEEKEKEKFIFKYEIEINRDLAKEVEVLKEQLEKRKKIFTFASSYEQAVDNITMLTKNYRDVRDDCIENRKKSNFLYIKEDIFRCGFEFGVKMCRKFKGWK